MFDLSKMSQTELQFVRLYVDALRRDFDRLTTVFAVSHPDDLAIKDIVCATKVASGLHELHQNFERRLSELPASKNARKRSAATGPSLEMLAKFFALSFFKLLKLQKENNVTKNVTDCSWYSGQPDHWQNSIDVLQKLLAEQPAAKPTPHGTLTTLFAALQQFFGGVNFTAYVVDTDTKNTPHKIWPVAEAATDWEDYDDDETEEDDLWGGWFL